MTLKRFSLLLSVFLSLVLAAFVGAYWTIGTDDGLGLLLGIVEKNLSGLPINVKFSAVEGNLIHGFTISDIVVTSGDAPAEELIRAKKLSLKLSMLQSQETPIFLELFEIDGAETTRRGLNSLIAYIANLSKGKPPQPVDFFVKSSRLREIPGVADLSLAELSLSKGGKLYFRGNIENVPLEGGGNIPFSDYVQFRGRGIDLKVGENGHAKVDIDIKPFPVFNAKFNKIGLQNLLRIFKAPLDAEGELAGTVRAEFLTGAVSVSGDVKAAGIMAYGVPVGSFSSPFNFSSSKMELNFPRVAGAMRGMENLKGNASINLRDIDGSFNLAGEKLSLAALQSTYKLNFPVSGENGKFNAAVKFSKNNVLGNISVNLPSVKIEKQTSENLVLNIDFKNDTANVKFSARAFGAPVSGAGTIKDFKNVDMKLKLTGLNIASISPMFPELKKLSASGIISAEIICKGAFDSLVLSGTANSDKFSVNGMDFQKVRLIIDEKGDFKLTSTSLNAKGQFKISDSSPQIKGVLNTGDFEVKFNGGTDAIEFDINANRISGGTAKGLGTVRFGTKPSLDVKLDVANVEVRPALAKLAKDGLSFGLGGIFTGEVRAQGALDAPKITISSKYPITFRELLLDKIFLALTPQNNGFAIDAKAFMGSAVEVKFTGDAQKAKNNSWRVNLLSNRVVLDDIIKARFPKFAEKISGRALVKVEIDTSSSKAVFTVETAHLYLFGFRIKALRVPIEYTGTEKEVAFSITRGNVGGALLDGSGSFDLVKQSWKASFTVKELFLEELTRHIFEPHGGRLRGRAGIELSLSGNMGIMVNVLGFGNFAARDGSLEGLPQLKNIDSSGKIEFDTAGGRFLFNGSDIILGTGSFINAKPNDKNYRFIRFSGPAGVMGNGINLNCRARIDAEVFNILVGAIESVLGFARGEDVLKSPVRMLAKKILGVDIRSFSDVSFRLSGKWDNISFSNIKMERQIERSAYALGDEKEREPSRNDIEVKLTVPVGPGSHPENAEDAVKRGLLDSIIDSLVPKLR